MDANQTALAYKELQTAYNFFNAELFDNELPSCIITLQRGARYMGYYSFKRFVGMGKLNGSTTDEIALNPEWFGRTPTIEIMQTLVHEMCHMWQAHFGKPSRTGYHNKQWAGKMESIGLMPSTTGAEGGNKVGQKMSDYPISGSRFHQAYLQHVSNGGGFLWRDKFSPRNWTVEIFEKKVQQYKTLGIDLTEIDFNLMNEIDKSKERKQNTNPQINTISNNTDDNSENYYETTDPKDQEDEHHQHIDIHNPHTSSTNRWKYQCCCKINVWGKPGLNLICGDCSGAFKNVG